VDWRRVELAELARFKHWVEVTPTRVGRARSGATVNAILSAVCELLRFCARSGLIEAAVAERLSEPRWLRFTPPGFDAGELGQFRRVRARALKARAATPFPEALTGEQLEAVLACCRRPREYFIVLLLRDTGLRIGEVLGLRREGFCLAGLPEGLRVELLYGLQQRDQAPPPLDPTEVQILLSRLGDAGSLRDADPHAVCESGGTVYNSSTRGLFRDLRRHLDRAWAQYSSTDPFAGDTWQVALLDLRINASRRWPATQGVVDFHVIEQPWLREVVKDWARATRYLQRLRETLRACRAASHALTAASSPANLGAGEFTRILDAISTERRVDGSLYSASHRNLMLYQFCQVIEHGRASGLMATVPVIGIEIAVLLVQIVGIETDDLRADRDSARGHRLGARPVVVGPRHDRQFALGGGQVLMAQAQGLSDTDACVPQESP
jgi:hypothetical protein